MNAPQLHIRYAGESEDIALSELDLSPNSSDAEVKTELARHLGIEVSSFRSYIVVQEENGSKTVRPEANFG